MSVWVIVILFAVIKLPLAALMIWLPFRSDSAADPDEAADADGGADDGGMKVTSESPRDPHPRRPRWPRRPRGPHGEPFSPPRTRRRWRVRRRPLVTRF